MRRADFIIEAEGVEVTPTRLVPIEVGRRRETGNSIALVKFDGTAITQNGDLVKHNWFKGLGLDGPQYSEIMLTAEEAKTLHAAQTRLKLGAASTIPMRCFGKLCPMSRCCPLFSIQEEIDARGEARKVLPLLKICPIEEQLLLETVQKLAEEFNVTDAPGHYTDQRIILELAECEVIENRMNAILATKDQNFAEDKIVAIIPEEYGDRTQTVKDVSDAFKVKEKVWARREKLRKALIATRFDQTKADAMTGAAIKVDASMVQSEIMQRIRKLEYFSKDD